MCRCSGENYCFLGLSGLYNIKKDKSTEQALYNVFKKCLFIYPFVNLSLHWLYFVEDLTPTVPEIKHDMSFGKIKAGNLCEGKSLWKPFKEINFQYKNSNAIASI